MPARLTLENVQESVEQSRNRPITITELSGLTGVDVCGLWLVLPDRDLILHAPVRSALHRQQIILHELSHMILRHDIDATNSGLSEQLMPDLDPALVLHVLRRSSFHNDAERTAEALADRIAARIMRGTPLSDKSEHLAFGEVFG
ncbi:hypothetical protein [Arthrobacter sp. 35W]|uniref:hypothetical protein n=1 Tax=Arthrobacter sp. 35W TaxID=1132441 RepID=UPI0012DF33C0|nr:hypothetical protein [Arthrobacter sp. 35W]